ncbi:MAG: hypothetical protein IPQ18_14795 [Saprospiraceae bacterium]|nr:hypothetical protein [Saprospiraceae bacterium]
MRTPIVALTAKFTKHDIELYLHKGMNDFITKPYDEQDFFRKINHVLSIYRDKSVGNPLDNYLTVDGDFPEKLYDLTQLEQISRGNDAFVKKMVSIFINQTQDSLATIENNIEENNLENISRIAHRLNPA